MFTKKDLKNGDMVVYRCGEKSIVYNDRLIGPNGQQGWLGNYSEKLKCMSNTKYHDLDIMQIYRGRDWDHIKDNCIYDREKEEKLSTKEMTLDEICKKLGYNVKIVKGEKK